MIDVLSIGSATKDFFLQGSYGVKDRNLLLPWGSRTSVDTLYSATGGSGTNVAVTFARQGLRTEAIVILGNDAAGNEIYKNLQSEGVITDHILRHSDDHTAMSFILVDNRGERTILTYKGEGQHLGLIPINEDIFDTRWLYLGSMGGNHDFFEKIIHIAFEKNILVASNPGVLDFKEGLNVLSPLFQKIDIVIMNHEEVGILLNKEVDPELAVKELAPHCKNIVIVTNGRQGVVVAAQGHYFKAATPEAPRVDATGAGDAFGSGFLVEYMRSDDIEKAIQFATANATSVVGQFGAQAGILRSGDLGLTDMVAIETL